MPDLSVDTLKDLFFLNKIYIGGATVWAFVVASIAAVASFQESTHHLSVMSWFGLVLGLIVSSVDATLECGQDCVYTDRPYCQHDSVCCEACSKCDWESDLDDNEDKRDAFKKSWDVDQKFSGISYVWLKNRRCWALQPDCACFALGLETVLRFFGNITLFALYVLATLNKWREAAKCRDGLEHWFPAILWVAIVINALRFLIGFSYRNYQEKKNDPRRRRAAFVELTSV